MMRIRLHTGWIALLSPVLLAGCGGRSTQPSAQAAANPPAIRYEAHVAAGERAPPGGILQRPQGNDAAASKSGAQLFSAMNCDGCHGAEGAGWVGPSLKDGRWRYGGADEEVFSSIYYGRPKGMPAFGGTLSSDGIWSLVIYLKSLPVPADIATESWDQP